MSGRRGAETAIELARAVRAELTVLFVAGPREPETQRRRSLLSREEQAALKEIAEIAERRDQMVRFRSRTSGERSEEIVQEAESAAATLVVLGVSLRPSEAMLFGETANRLLEESESSLLFVAS